MIPSMPLLLLALVAPSQGAVGAFNPCDCKDLPRLFQELMEQEKLRELADEYLKSKTPVEDEFQSKQDISDRLQWRLNQYNNGRSAQRVGDSGTGPASRGGAAPAFGTNFMDKGCGLVKFLPKNADGTQPDPVPITEEEIRAAECSAFSEFLIDHEKLHQERCRQRWAREKSGLSLLQPRNYLEEDRDAYAKGVQTLRREIASLARDCGWKGSTRKFKNGRREVVPTQEQIQDLKDKAKRKAAALGKETKR